jgi:RHS repeat-associated protein
MNKTTQTWVQLVCLLSISALLAQQAGATNAAVYVSMFVSGGDAEQRTSATYGGFGGSVIVKTGVGDINPGDGSDGPLTHDITLTSGTHNYTYVYMDIEHGGTTPPTITVDGDVTINCQGFFAPTAVVGKFVPNQGGPPHVRINAGHPIITVFGTQINLGFHSASFQMSARYTSPAPVNSDGSGMDGGSVQFFTSEAGDIVGVGGNAFGGMGLNGGNGGDGGSITLVATGGNILAGGMFVDGGAAIGAIDPGYYGGTGGDGGSIYLSGIEIVNAVPSSPFWLSADGGDGGMAGPGTIDHPCVGNGGNGGNGGGIAVYGMLSEGGSFPATATGGDGGLGGFPCSLSPISGNGQAGCPGGDGGDGGAPGVIVGLLGTTTPGNGRDAGGGGNGEAGHLLPPPFGYDSPGGNGGAGGNGGKSGGAGAQAGNGGTGGTGGDGSPPGVAGQAGAVGGGGEHPPANPPTDGGGSNCTISGDGSVTNAGINPPNNRLDSLVEEPVDTGTGAHILQRSLLKVQGAQGLEFTADYDSICRFNDVMGVGWSHNFEANVQPMTNGKVLLHWNAKRSNLFIPNPLNTNLLFCSDVAVVYDTLIRNPNASYSLKQPNQQHYEFDNAGRLQQIVNAQGQAIQLFYNSTNTCPGQIQEAISGKSLYLTYNMNSELLTSVSDGSGRSVSFCYDYLDHLTQITNSDATTSQTYYLYYDSVGHVLYEYNPEGGEVFYDSYDSAGRIAAQEDALYHHTYFYYDESQSNRLVTTVVDRTGATNIYVHNQRYLLLSVTDGLGHTTRYGYDTNGNRTSITNALGQVQKYAYDNAGNLIASTDAAGRTTTCQFDSRNNLISMVNAVTNTATFAYDGNNNLTASVNVMTNQTTMAYDANSQLIQTISPRGGNATFVHITGLTSQITNAASNVTRMAYDAVGRLIAVTNADGFVSTNAYDLNDNLIAKSDGLGNVWHYTYDSAGRKLTATDPLTNAIRFAYDGNGNLIAQTNALGYVTLYTYDGEDRLASVTDPNGHTKSMKHDAAGRLLSVVDALNHTNSLKYDVVGNLVATVDALGITNQISTYDVRNQPVAIKDALGNTKRMSYDALQRLIQTADALNRTNYLAYDALSHLTTSTDPLSLVSRQQFDTDGNRTAIINPRIATTTFAYDLANRLTNTITPTGKQTGYVLDGRNLITKITPPSGALTIFTYDAAGRLIQSQDSVGTISYTYDNKGRLLTVTENGKAITRQYDALDRLTQYTDAAGNVLQYGYDYLGNLTSLTYPDGKTVNYSYDAANRLASVSDWGGRLTSYAYDANGRATNITHSDGTITTRAHDVAGRLVQQKDVTSNASNIFTVNFAYDAAAQIVGETNLPVATNYQPAIVTMNYDADNALTAYGGQAVTTDANGNMTSGPLTNATFATYTYDARNRLTGVGGITYAYDPAGNRVALTNNSIATRFMVNPNAALSQVLVRVKNGVTNYYVYGLGLLYEVTPTNGTSKVLTYHYDYRGSTVALTDGSGNVTDRVSYSPYGSITSRTGTNDTPFLFNGSYGVITEPNGQLNMRARFYNPTICRFLNPDQTGFFSAPNFYVYANGNPVSLTDPAGLCAQDQDEAQKSSNEYAHLQSGMLKLNGNMPLQDGWFKVYNDFHLWFAKETANNPFFRFTDSAFAHENLVQVVGGNVVRVEGYYNTGGSPISVSAQEAGKSPANNEPILFMEKVQASSEAVEFAVEAARSELFGFSSGGSIFFLFGHQCQNCVSDVERYANMFDVLNRAISH